MLEDTSFAIHPGQKQKHNLNDFLDIGRVETYRKSEDGLVISTRTGELALSFYSDEIVRVIFQPFANVTFKSSPAVIMEPVRHNFTVDEDVQKQELIIQSTKLKIVVSNDPIRIHIQNQIGNTILKQGNKGIGYKNNGMVVCYVEMEEDDHFYGLGEKTGYLDKRGEKVTMWNTDVFAPHNPETDPLYQSIPYFMMLRKGKAVGVFLDNTFKTSFDFKTSQDECLFEAEGGQLDFYVFAGPEPKRVIEQYTMVTGRAPIPPKWAIGYHQSRYSYETEQEVRELAALFSDKGIPLDAIYLDIHYMDGYRVFTFDHDRFPDPQKLIEDLKKQGIRVVPIVDPGVKADPEYEIYKKGVKNDYFCKYIEGEIYFGEVWPGKSAFPDFTSKKTRDWWGTNHRYYTDVGIEGIWNDMNEPSVFNESKTMDEQVMHKNDGDPKTHRELHNVYGLLMGKATYEGMKKNLAGSRPFLLTRAGFSGVQRYSAVWTGDNRSFWEHLQMSLPMVMNLGISGIPFAGPDVGGFAHDSNGELLVRWTQVGAFTPYFRNHSAIGTVRQEPWSFGGKYEKIIKKYIELRYQWLPHFYSLFAEAFRNGTPVMRPLMLEYPEDPQTYNLYDQFMIGENILIAPIMQPSSSHRVVYLPEGKWIDYWTGEEFTGSAHHLLEANLETLPIFIKKGTMIAHGPIRLSAVDVDTKRTLHLYFEEGTTTVFKLYDDDGKTFEYEKGNYCLKTFNVKMEDETVELYVNFEGTFTPSYQVMELVIHGAPKLNNLVVNGVIKNVQKKTEKTCVFYL